MLTRRIAILALLPALASAQAQTPPDDGISWRTIGSPGNRGPTEAEAPGLGFPDAGRVDYVYRLSTTEVTVSQWFEFVQAYWPYQTSSGLNDPSFTSSYIQRTSYAPGQNPQYQITPGTENYPANMGWRSAAIYCNWLTNGKATTASAFQNGAYDTSTFVTHPDGTRDDQVTHNSGATFWIPSWDEWIKGAFYDPNRYGQGKDGYWRYNGSAASLLTTGAPGDPGAQTDAGYFNQFGPNFPVGSYPQTTSPWGLLDTSGGLPEMTETLLGGAFDPARDRRRMGSSASEQGLQGLYDRIDAYGTTFDGDILTGLRIASIPSPSVCSMLAIGMMTQCHQRRRR
jgi:formylglycine-generating enzyme required for sulfatase activity